MLPTAIPPRMRKRASIVSTITPRPVSPSFQPAKPWPEPWTSGSINGLISVAPRPTSVSVNSASAMERTR